MEAINLWWAGLNALTQGFFIAAAFFSVFFLWQLIMAIVGLGGGGMDMDSGPNWEHQSPADAQDSLLAFQLLSVRSILAFATLFTWAGALYLMQGAGVGRALFLALLWGVAAMVLVSWLLHALRKLTESGNLRVQTCVGAEGAVVLDIPADGAGEVRVLCSGQLTHFKARTADGKPLKAGSSVRVVRVRGSYVLDVEPENTKETTS